jgi:isocitrate dehydrogenase (NAD+)
MAHNVTLIPGDWIGPETAAVAKVVIAAAGVEIDWDEQCVGDDGITETILESCRNSGVVLKGRLASPPTVGQLPPTVQLRKALGLYATVRPVTALPNTQARFPDIDVIVVRETSEDIYAGFEHEVTKGVFEAVKITTRSACERIARVAFELAVSQGRKKVTIVHKSNIMKKSDGMFLSVAQAVAKEFPQIVCEEAIVDALCMRLVKWPMQFDVVLAANLFGDIVSDLCSGLAGGITASPSASYGQDMAMFENPHGRAPSLTGTGRANPIPMLRTAVLMLSYLGEEVASARIDTAIKAVSAGELRAVDQGGEDGCAAFQAAILDNLK